MKEANVIYYSDEEKVIAAEIPAAIWADAYESGFISAIVISNGEIVGRVNDTNS